MDNKNETTKTVCEALVKVVKIEAIMAILTGNTLLGHALKYIIKK